MTDEAENFLLSDAPDLESVRMPPPNVIRRHGKAAFRAMLKREHLIAAGERRLAIAGSANLTANPRLEQYILIDDPEVYAFHRSWMEAMLE